VTGGSLSERSAKGDMGAKQVDTEPHGESKKVHNMREKRRRAVLVLYLKLQEKST